MIKRIETNKAPQAIGPYSQAVSSKIEKEWVFVSGQLPIDPKTNKLVEGDIQDQVRQVIDNLEAILKEAGTDIHHVTRVDIFLKDLKKDFAGMNEEYSKRFVGMTPPARQTVQVAELPLGSPVEISCIAFVP